MQVGHFRSQNVRVKRRFTPLEFIWVIMILCVVHMSGVLHMQPHTPDTLKHSFVIFKRRQSLQEREACKYVPVLVKLLLSVCRKDVHWKGKVAQ